MGELWYLACRVASNDSDSGWVNQVPILILIVWNLSILLARKIGPNSGGERQVKSIYTGVALDDRLRSHGKREVQA